jgi:hypothetical protein
VPARIGRTHACRPTADAEAGRATGKPQSEALATEAQAESAAPAPPPAAQAARPAPDASVAQTVAATVPVLADRIARATAQLKSPSSVSDECGLIALITECATAIKALREL